MFNTLRLHYRLDRLEQRISERMDLMALDLSKITAAAQRSTADIEKLLALAADTKAQLDTVSAQLTAAIAANDPAALAAAQTALDALATELDAEATKIEAAQPAPAAPPAAPAA